MERMPMSPATRTVLFALWIFVYLFWMFRPLTLDPKTYLPDDGDALQGVSVLGWVSEQYFSGLFDIFDMNVYYPHPKGLVYSEHLLPQGLLVALLRSLGCDLILAYNLVWAGTILIIALSVRLWVRELGASESAASVAGCAVALTTSTLFEISRLQMLSFQWIPLALFCLHRFFRTGRTRWSVAIAVCLVLQGLSGQYYLISFPLFLLPIVVGYAYLFPERRTLGSAFRLTIPSTLGALLLLLIGLQYLGIFQRYGFERPLVSSGADLLSYVVPPTTNLFYGWLWSSSMPAITGTKTFLGYGAIALAIVGLISLWRHQSNEPATRRYRWLSLWLAIWGGFFILLAAGAEVNVGGQKLAPGIFSVFHDYIPGFKYTRVPARWSVYSLFGISILIGAGAERLARCVSSRIVLQNAVVIVFLVALPLEHARTHPFHKRIPTEAEIPAVYQWLRTIPGDFAIVDLPTYPNRFIRFHGYQTYFSVFHRKRIPFGKPSFRPPGLDYIQWTLSRFPSREATRLLQALQIKFVIYHPAQDDHSRRVIRRLRRDPNFVLVKRFPRALPEFKELGYGGERVFLVTSEAVVPPPLYINERSIPRRNWRFKSSSNGNPLLAVDGKGDTAWSSKSSQRKGQYFDIEFGAEYSVSRISLGFGYPYSTFPRHLEVNGYHHAFGGRRLQFESNAWRNAWVVQDLVEDPKVATIDLTLEKPLPLERIRLFLNRTEPGDVLPEWRIPEIEVFERH